MSRIFLLFTLAVSFLLTACGQSATAEPAASPTTPPDTELPVSDSTWTITMMHSGGIMGLARSIEVSSDGKFTITDERTSVTKSGELTPDELSTLNALVTTAKFETGKPDGRVCADCFVYEIEIQRNNEHFAARMTDLELPGSGVEPLVNHLRGLIDANLR